MSARESLETSIFGCFAVILTSNCVWIVSAYDFQSISLRDAMKSKLQTG
jgi:hypothetical protein